MLFRLAVWLPLALAPSLFAQGAGLYEYMIPGTRMVIGMNVRQIRQSTLAQKLTEQVRSQAPEINRLTNTMGFDPITAIDEILLVSTAGGKNPPTLVLARGRFPMADSLPGTTRYHGAILTRFNAEPTQDAVMAFVDDSVAIMGEDALVREAIDRRFRGTVPPAAIVRQAEALAARYAIYGFGSIPPGSLERQGAPPMITGIDQFQFGLAMSRSLELAAQVHARTTRDAESMAQGVQLLGTMLSRQKGAEELAKTLQVSMDGATLKIGFTIPEQDILRVMDQRLPPSGSRLPTLAATLRSTSQPGTDAAPVTPNAIALPDVARVPEGASLVITGSDVDGGSLVVKK